MSDSVKKSVLDDPKTLLTLIEIGVLLATLIWVFAFMRADVNRHDNQIKDHEVQLKEHNTLINEQNVKQAVTNEQYRQIMNELKKINEKMDSRR